MSEDEKKPKENKNRKKSLGLFIICIIIVIIAVGASIIIFQHQQNTTVNLEKSSFQLPNGTQLSNDTDSNKSNIITLTDYNGEGEITVMEDSSLSQSDLEDYTIESDTYKNISGVKVEVIEVTNNNNNDHGETDYKFSKNGINYVISSTSSGYYVQDIIKTLTKNN